MFRFDEIDIAYLEGKTIFVDIDGTLLHDGTSTVSPTILEKLKQLGHRNRVYLCSNARDHARGTRIAREANVHYVTTEHKKPSPQILHAIPEANSPYVVIGDKMLTDGLFAFSIGADFIKVHRYISLEGSTRLTTALANGIDDILTYLAAVIHMMRPVQQVKNVFILAPLFFAQKVFEIESVVPTLIATLLFCFLAGGIYALNDIADVESDRKHPRKRTRPLAAGLLSVRAATLTTSLIIIGVFTAALFFVPAVTPFLVAYVALNLGYSYWLKHIYIVDILTVSSFYLIRILVGGVAAQVFISSWLIQTTIFIALFLVIGKRLSEARGANLRKVLNEYTEDFLSKLLGITATVTIISYALYAVLQFETQNMIYSIFPVLLGIFRYLHILSNGTAGESPERILIKDRMVQFSVLCWLIIVSFIFY